jgi:uncharacterized protein
MKARKIWANFSVQDAERSRKFYTQLGFPPFGPNNVPNLASFIFGEDDLVIHFFEQGSQIDSYLPPGPAKGEIIFTLAADTEAEVREWADKVKQAGGMLFSEAARDEANYFGFAFADPDGHKFNIILMDQLGQ